MITATSMYVFAYSGSLPNQNTRAVKCQDLLWRRVTVLGIGIRFRAIRKPGIRICSKNG